MIARAEDIYPLPPECNTVGLLHDMVNLEEKRALNPDHELFIVVSRKGAPQDHFAFVMRIRKDVAHIQNRMPLEIDMNSRILVLYDAGCAPGTPPDIAARVKAQAAARKQAQP